MSSQDSDRAAESCASSPAVARTMRGNRRRDTRPELEIRRRPNVAANALNVVSDFVEG